MFQFSGRITKVPRFMAGVAKQLNNVLALHSKGLVIDSNDIIPEQQPDGRIRLRLNPKQGWRQGSSASTTTITGACCIGTDCSITTEADCAGTWHGAGSGCNPNPCDMGCAFSGCAPEDSPITVQFYGITFGCGCTELNDGRGMCTDLGGVNASFVLPYAGPNFWYVETSDVVHVQLWDAESCDGDPGFETDAGGSIVAQCDPETGIWGISFSSTYNLWWFFGHGSNLCAIPNEAICGPVFADNQIATGGGAVITW